MTASAASFETLNTPPLRPMSHARVSRAHVRLLLSNLILDGNLLLRCP